jgi:hypothetical protein
LSPGPLPALCVCGSRYPDTKLGQSCYIVRDADGHALAYVYFEDEPGRSAAAHLMTRDEARRIAANIAKLPERSSTTDPQGFEHHFPPA